MKFHLVAGSMIAFSVFLVYRLLFGFQEEMEVARPKIRKESVKSLTQESKVQTRQEVSTFINKNLQVEVKPKEPSIMVAERESPRHEPEIIPPPEQRSLQDGRNFWCRNVPVTLETNPVRCLYPESCYGCEGPIIRPEVEEATPLCANGSMSQLYHVECCPHYSRGVAECPSSDACFQAENVPNDFCTCSDRPDCKLVQVGSKIECLCIQN